MTDKVSTDEAVPLSLKKVVDRGRQFLRRGKVVGESEINYVGCGIGLVKELKEVRFEDRTASVALQKEAQSLIEQLVRRLSEVKLDISDADGSRCSDILAHYRAAELADDATLAEEFENYRADYIQHPTDGSKCLRYGWMLHDCLKAAYGRLHNVKLTEFFKREFEAWQYRGAGQFDQNLEQCRARDLKNAEAFLNGPREALVLLSSGEWEKAKKAADEYLASNPGNAAAFGVVIRACERIDRVEVAVDMLNAAATAVRWHPQEVEFQRWFIRAAVKIRRRVFASVTGKNQNESESIVRWGCGELIKQCCGNFKLLNLITPGTSEYSCLMSVVVSASELIFKLRGQMSDLKCQLAPIVVLFARSWGLANFRPEDKEPSLKGSRRYSLAGRTVIVLMKYCACGVSQDDLVWIQHVVGQYKPLFRKDPVGYLNAAASLYHAYGNEEESRRFAIDLVRCDQSEGWRWLVLARTYPKGSQERSDCIIRAKSKREQENIISVMKTLEETLQIDLKGYFVNSEEKNFGYEEANHRAEQLLTREASEIPGVVITRFKDNVSQADVLRVWWRDPKDGSARSDFVSFQEARDIGTVGLGAPVLVSVVDIGVQKKVVGVSPRTNGSAWDVYPFCDAVVVAKNEGRHYARIAFGAGMTCSVDLRKLPAASMLSTGDFCRVAVWKRERMSALALAVQTSNGLHQSLPFCKEYRGVLQRRKGSRDGWVEDVKVPPEARGVNYFGTSVCGLAVALGDEEWPQWSAVTCKPFNDLEVLQ